MSKRVRVFLGLLLTLAALLCGHFLLPHKFFFQAGTGIIGGIGLLLAASKPKPKQDGESHIGDKEKERITTLKL